MLQVTNASTGNDGYFQRLRKRACKFDVEAGLRSVLVHAREENLTGTCRLHSSSPFKGIQSGWTAAAVGKNFPVWDGAGHSLRVHSNDNALGTISPGCIFDQL